MKNFQIKIFFESFQDMFFQKIKKEDSIFKLLESLPSIFNRKDFYKEDLSKYEGVHFENPNTIFIGKGTKIEKGAYIKGPCIIGNNNEIRHGAYIRENVLTFDGCLIGHATEIKNSIMLENSKAAHFSYIGDSVLGKNVNLGAGVKIANYRLDKGKPSLMFENNLIKPNLKKLGAIIGDNVQIGCNSVLYPFTIIGRNSICYPLTHIRGIIPGFTIVKPSDKGNVKLIKSRCKSK